MKEWDRRPSERQGFNDGPGDCLAFKFLRDVSGKTSSIVALGMCSADSAVACAAA
jgi:hypothetical protein